MRFSNIRRCNSVPTVLVVSAIIASLMMVAPTRAAIHGGALRYAASQTCPAWPGGTGILVDGDFSQAVEPESYVTYKRGQAFAPDWLVTKHTIDLARDYPGFQAPNGVCSVDLDGTPGAGAIVHSKFATKPNVNYTVTFELSGNGGGPPTVKLLLVEAAGQFAAFTWDVSGGHDASHGDYAQEQWTFTASSKTTTLTFISGDKHARTITHGPVVAAIAVTEGGSR